ncbi:MAG: EAL domain-containing protein [Patulibacter sp.]
MEPQSVTARAPLPLALGVGTALYALLATWALAVGGPHGAPDWYPAAGLAVGLVTVGGARMAFVPLAGTILTLPVPLTLASLPGVLAAGVAIAATSTAGGLALRRTINVDRPLARVRDVWALIGIGLLAVPIVSAIAVIGLLIAAGVVNADVASWPMLRDLILGYALGIATVTPTILLASAAWSRAPRARAAVPRRVLAQPQAVAALVALIFATPSIYVLGGESLRGVAMLPLSWIALRFGVVGAVTGAVTWSASSGALLTIVGPQAALLGLQGFLLTGTMLALIIGSVVSEREHSQRALRHLALHDQLTGLPNEAKLLELLGRRLHAGGAAEITAILIRFAGLRSVAANLQPHETSELIRLIAQRLATIAGPNATLARPAFPRFAILASDLTREQREALAQRIARELAAPLSIGGRDLLVDPRVGLTVGLPGETPAAILAHADHAADTLSSAESDRVGYYDAVMERARRDREELAEDLRVATERGDFLLAFQPIVTAREGRVVAAEALLRWVDLRRGAVNPDAFIPLAEDTGMICQIGRWVLSEACTRAAQWPHVGNQPISVTVNISPVQLLSEGFVDDVLAALNRSGLPAERLHIEITEGISVNDLDGAVQQVTRLRELGVGSMLDGFGTGHSSLTWMQRLPVSGIKIDRAFVNDIAQDGVDRAIVHASLYLSRALGAETVAAGVETEAQREQLLRMGCERLQGYLFARPQPADVFPVWLSKQRARAEAATQRDPGNGRTHGGPVAGSRPANARRPDDPSLTATPAGPRFAA